MSVLNWIYPNQYAINLFELFMNFLPEVGMINRRFSVYAQVG